MIPQSPKKIYDLPTIDPEDMTPQIAALLAFIEEQLRIRDAAYDEGVALRKEIADLKRAKQRASRSPK